MYKVLILQQNKEQVRLIKESILNNFDEVFVLCTSMSDMFLELINKEHPDIVFLGIELSDANGMDLASEVMKISPESHIVFLSCYDYYEFVKNAMHIGADDYLLTPITELDVVNTMKALIRKVDNYRAVKVTEQKNREYMNDTKDLLGYGFIYSIVYGDTLKKNVHDYKRILGISEKGYWYNVEIKEESYREKIDYVQLVGFVSDILKKYVKYIVGPKLGDRYLFYIPVYEDDNRFVDEDFPVDIAKNIKSYINSKVNMNIDIGIGSIRCLDELYISYEESIKCLRNKKDIIKYVGSDNNELYVKIAVIEKRLLESIELDKDDVRRLFVLLLQQYEAFSIEERKSKIFENFILLNHKIGTLVNSNNYGINSMELYKEISGLDEQNIDIYAINRFELMIKNMQRFNTQNFSVAVKKAIHYMHEHYNENISLNEISNLVGVSVQYFSKIFKDEVGCKYVDWLNTLRINRAKELMNTSKMTIKEVGFHVGYNDPNYFSRIFKRYEGIAPTEYVNKKEVS